MAIFPVLCRFCHSGAFLLFLLCQLGIVLLRTYCIPCEMFLYFIGVQRKRSFSRFKVEFSSPRGVIVGVQRKHQFLAVRLGVPRHRASILRASRRAVRGMDLATHLTCISASIMRTWLCYFETVFVDVQRYVQFRSLSY
jgi:hypothetical protein